MDSLKRGVGVGIWTLVCLILFSSIAYMLLRLWSARAVFFTIPEQLVSLLDQTAATLVGVVVGIPVALWLSRRQQGEEEKQAVKKTAIVKRDRCYRVLRQLQDELEYNVGSLRTVIMKQNEYPRAHLLYGHKVTTWQAMSASEELQWIDSPEILGRLSWAYYHLEGLIETEKRLQQQWLQQKADATLEELYSKRKDTLPELEATVEVVDAELRRLKKTKLDDECKNS